MVLRKCYAEVLSQGVRSRCVQDDSTAHWITLVRLLCTCAEWGRAAREWMTWGSCECENTSCESLPCHVRAWHASQCSMPPTIVHAPHIKASHSSTCSSFPFPAYTLAIMTGAESSVKVTKPCWLHLTQFIAIHSKMLILGRLCFFATHLAPCGLFLIAKWWLWPPLILCKSFYLHHLDYPSVRKLTFA